MQLMRNLQRKREVCSVEERNLQRKREMCSVGARFVLFVHSIRWGGGAGRSTLLIEHVFG